MKRPASAPGTATRLLPPPHHLRRHHKDIAALTQTHDAMPGFDRRRHVPGGDHPPRMRARDDFQGTGRLVTGIEVDAHHERRPCRPDWLQMPASEPGHGRLVPGFNRDQTRLHSEQGRSDRAKRRMLGKPALVADRKAVGRGRNQGPMEGVQPGQIVPAQRVFDDDNAAVGIGPRDGRKQPRIGCDGRPAQCAIALTMFSVIFLASPSTMTVLSR